MDSTLFYEEQLSKAEETALGFAQRKHRWLLLLTALIALVASLLVGFVLAVGTKLILDGSEAFGQSDFEAFEIIYLLLFWWALTWLPCLLLIDRLHNSFRRWRRKKGEGLEEHFSLGAKLCKELLEKRPGASAIVIGRKGAPGRPRLGTMLMILWATCWAVFTLPLATFSLGWIGAIGSHLTLLCWALALYCEEKNHSIVLLTLPPLTLCWFVLFVSFFPTGSLLLLPLVYLVVKNLHRFWLAWKTKETKQLLFVEEGKALLDKGADRALEVFSFSPLSIKPEGYETYLEADDGDMHLFTFASAAELEHILDTGLNIFQPLREKSEAPVWKRHASFFFAACYLFSASFLAPAVFVGTTTVEELFQDWPKQDKSLILTKANRMCQWLPFAQAAYALRAVMFAEEGEYEKALAELDYLEEFTGKPTKDLRGLAQFRRSGFKQFCSMANGTVSNENVNQLEKAKRLLSLAEKGLYLPSRESVNLVTQKFLRKDSSREGKLLLARCLGRTVWFWAFIPSIAPAKMKSSYESALQLMKEISGSPSEFGSLSFRNEDFEGTVNLLQGSPIRKDKLLWLSAMRFVNKELKVAIDLSLEMNEPKLTALLMAQQGRYEEAQLYLQGLKDLEAKLLSLLIAHQNRKPLPKIKGSIPPGAAFSFWLADVDLEYLADLIRLNEKEREKENMRIILSSFDTEDKRKTQRGFPRLANLKWYPYRERAKEMLKITLEAPVSYTASEKGGN